MFQPKLKKGNNLKEFFKTILFYLLDFLKINYEVHIPKLNKNLHDTTFHKRMGN